MRESVRGGLQQAVEGVQQAVDVAEGVLEESGVVADVLGGGVDFVGDAGGQLADRLHPLGLGQFHAHPLLFLQQPPLLDGPAPRPTEAR